MQARKEPGNETSRQPRALVDAVLGGCHIGHNGALGRSLGMTLVSSSSSAMNLLCYCVGWMPYWCTGEEPGNETSRHPGGCNVSTLTAVNVLHPSSL